MTCILDISVALSPGRTPIWPGDPPLQRSLVWQIGEHSDANVSCLSMSVHTGTHIDAPAHYLPGGAGVDSLDLATLIGPCSVCAVDTVGDLVTARDLDALQLPAGVRRLLLKTRNSSLWQQHAGVFQSNFVSLAPDAAQWIVQRGVRVIGIDYLSVEPVDCANPLVHRTLLAAGVIPLEGLNLAGVTPGSYALVCLPLKMDGSDGAPARAILIKE